MTTVFLLKVGEIILKGLNKGAFERVLMKNIRYSLKKIGEFKVYSKQSTIYVEPLGENQPLDQAQEILTKTFGVVSVCRATPCPKDIDIISEKTAELMGADLKDANSFYVVSKRADKNFPLSSTGISQHVGGYLHDLYPHLKVNTENPDILIKIEIRDEFAFIHKNPIDGAGGMPVSCNGRGVLLLSGGLDSPVAGYMMAKRGLQLYGVHFHSYPYTSERALDKVVALRDKLTDWTGHINLAVVPFTKIQEEIAKHTEADYSTILMRRFMMRIAEQIAKNENCGGLITGESLGQVASQTMEALGVTGECCTLPILRPLIGMDKTEIVKIARRIDTFETSILPYEDCCTVFTPKHPKTKPRLYEVLREEAKLDVEALVKEAVEGITYA